MKLPSDFVVRLPGLAVRTADLALLRSASLLVPGGQRAEWWREWYAELWQARREYSFADKFSWASERAITGFCIGAFQDAFYLRRMDRRKRTPLTLKFGSAWQCLLLMAALLGASFILTRLLPGVRAERSLVRQGMRSGLLLIEDVNNEDSPRTISSGQYRAWKDRKQEFFDGFAFYRVTQERVNWRPVEDSSHESAGWGVGRASSNFFTLLGVPVQFREAGANVDATMPSVILSEGLWKREFGADPHVAGSVVRVGSRWATIAGVATEGPSSLPGKVDAWLLEPDSQMVSSGAGYVVAHLSDSGKSRMRSAQVQITSFAPHRSPDDMLGISLGNGMRGTWDVFRFVVLLAFLALPAVSSVTLGDLSVSVHKVSWPRRLLRWGFLGAKIALLLPIVYFISFDIAFSFTGLNNGQALSIQAVSTFLMCLFGMQWILNDQRQRCPVCMRRVDHPARVGQLSRTFLAWSGTELMCMNGHTLLHVPSLPTSWFSSQRWMYLDQSWEFLFAGPVRE
jgi:hypothetical protein